MLRKNNLLLIILMLGITLNLNAKHIIGGVITYECLGQGKYKFTMKMYRDCYGGGALFDQKASMGIFEKSGSSYTRVSPLDYSIPITSTRDVPLPELTCLVAPSNICVQEAVYEWEYTFSDWPSNSSYIIAYQRCCRNNTISNIVDPSTTGSTFSVEITPQSQNLCNNSPTFQAFPPTVICANSIFNYYQSAADTENDQIVYSFCSPLVGGGPYGSEILDGDPNACDGVAPKPICLPPYYPVTYLLPNYSTTQPVPGAPPLTINPNTGLISGIPNQIGQYVVGVCMNEYRDGVFLSTIRRDFQFNVTSCDQSVFADVQENEMVGDSIFIINSCGDYNVNLVNESFIRQFIDQYRWTFNIGGVDTTFTDWSPSIVFPDTGRYEGVLVLNEGFVCGDTAKVIVNILPKTYPDFTFDYDTCVAGPIEFTDLSYSDGGDIISRNWLFEPDSTSTEQNPSYLYRTPGLKPITLSVTDVNHCTVDTTKLVNWYPVPPYLLVEPNSFVGCIPMDIFFNNLSLPIDSTYHIVWDFGDGKFSDAINPTHTYDEAGIYTVSLSVTSPLGCYITDTFPSWIEAKISPIADFTYTPTTFNQFTSTVTCEDHSLNAYYWRWFFDDESTTSIRNPSYTFQDTGLQKITLIVTHPNGCRDTLTKIIDIVPEIRYFLPNAFTPNDDALNEFFQPAGYFEGVTNYEFSIWNRWGERVFSTNDPSQGWNGRKNNNGETSPVGVYVYLAKFTAPRGENFEYKGFCTLIR